MQVRAADVDDWEAPKARLREALRRGHRVASHSLDHPRFDGLVRAERRRQIAESRARIADLLGVAPHGFRAPNFEIDREVLELEHVLGGGGGSRPLPAGGGPDLVAHRSLGSSASRSASPMMMNTRTTTER